MKVYTKKLLLGLGETLVLGFVSASQNLVPPISGQHIQADMRDQMVILEPVKQVPHMSFWSPGMLDRITGFLSPEILLLIACTSKEKRLGVAEWVSTKLDASEPLDKGLISIKQCLKILALSDKLNLTPNQCLEYVLSEYSGLHFENLDDCVDSLMAFNVLERNLWNRLTELKNSAGNLSYTDASPIRPRDLELVRAYLTELLDIPGRLELESLSLPERSNREPEYHLAFRRGKLHLSNDRSQDKIHWTLGHEKKSIVIIYSRYCKSLHMTLHRDNDPHPIRKICVPIESSFYNLSPAKLPEELALTHQIFEILRTQFGSLRDQASLLYRQTKRSWNRLEAGKVLRLENQEAAIAQEMCDVARRVSEVYNIAYLATDHASRVRFSARKAQLDSRQSTNTVRPKLLPVGRIGGA